MLPEAIFFDFDGTLMDTEWAIYSAWLRTFRDEGQELPIEVYVQCIGSDFDTWSPKLHLEELTGRSFDWEEMDASRQIEIEAELATQGAVEGARELLESLQGKTRLAVVSSSSHGWVDGWLGRLGLAEFFENTTCRGDAPRIKPAPDLYQACSETLAVPPSGCLVIEDSLNGVRSAKTAGMTAFAIPNRITTVSDFAEADRVFSNLRELGAALLSE
ncbi:HAD family hydrolase [Roseibacillus persicicus]|uniref:HAD family hydrolase n=1 Tax=Roseibacillus persicicus TaxID=454148 RepID=UPI00280D3E83|nr:HAD family phosphatase [Roseibacillus persicicus]MDQ8190779.1 HAD family phosphatase [Roseibacillus persicicus]